MTTQQPEALRLAVSSSAMADEGEMIHLLSWYEIRNLLRADAAELRRLHTENTALQQGYAAARLEIESLQSRIKTMAEEHADELMVAHLDGRMRAAQPAGAQQPGVVYAALPGQGVPSYSDDALRMVRASELRAFADATCALRASHGQAPAQAAPAYKDSTPELHVGDSAFESWYSTYSPTHKGDKQRARDAYVAGMGDPLVMAAPAAVAGPSEFPHEQMDALALARYKVVPSHESMFHRHAVVAGDGSQQLYIGREVECENMARKFAGAFIDGAFAFHSMLAAAPTAQPAPQQEAQRPWGYAWRQSPFGWGFCSKQAYEQAAGRGEEVAKLYTAPQQEVQEPVAWYVTGCGRLLDEDEAKAEARHIGGTARAIPLYTAPQADSVLEDAARWTTEQEHAIRQGHEIAASDSYFEARPQIDSNDSRKVFQAGFERGWDAARKQGENHD